VRVGLTPVPVVGCPSKPVSKQPKLEPKETETNRNKPKNQQFFTEETLKLDLPPIHLPLDLSFCKQDVLPLNVCVQQRTVLPLDISVLQQSLLPIGAYLFYSNCAAPGHICSTAVFAAN
jgi:hypothetical protein